MWLPSGGSLVIDRTEAMTVIDVNTGKFTGKGGNLEETVTRNNLEAAEEIVRQLRLRDVGGMIVIDFIDMVLESNRELVLRRLTECLGRDRTRHQVAEVTSLGLVQMTRKRVGQGLLEAFSEPCEHCGGRGLIVHSEPVDDKRQNGGGNGGRRTAGAGPTPGPSARRAAGARGAVPGAATRRRRAGRTSRRRTPPNQPPPSPRSPRPRRSDPSRARRTAGSTSTAGSPPASARPRSRPPTSPRTCRNRPVTTTTRSARPSRSRSTSSPPRVPGAGAVGGPQVDRPAHRHRSRRADRRAARSVESTPVADAPTVLPSSVVADDLAAVRQRNPLTHCITNRS